MAKAKHLAKPPTEAAIRARAVAYSSQKFAHQQALRAMWQARLQAVIITPRAIENEVGEAQDLFRQCRDLDPDALHKVQELHQRLARVIADALWRNGTIEPDRARVLNALAAMIHASDNWRTLPWKEAGK